MSQLRHFLYFVSSFDKALYTVALLAIHRVCSLSRATTPKGAPSQLLKKKKLSFYINIKLTCTYKSKHEYMYNDKKKAFYGERSRQAKHTCAILTSARATNRTMFAAECK